MKYVLLLEKEQKLQVEITETLKRIDPELTMKIFATLQELAEWTKDLVEKQLPVLFPTDATPQVVLIILQKEQLGTNFMSLLKKLKPSLIKHKLIPPDVPVGVVLTAFEDPEFSHQNFEDKAITNVIFKPFDKLILEQHLRFALPPNKESKGEEQQVYHMETEVKVEMLKDVEMKSFSELGFVTKSYLPINVGKISKYYDEIFRVSTQRHVFAQCVNCVKYPNEDAYEVHFQYVGVDTQLVNGLRKNLGNTHDEKLTPISVDYAAKKSTPLRLQLFIMDDELREKMLTVIKEILPTVTVPEFKKEALKELKEYPSTDLVVVDPTTYSIALKYAPSEQMLVISFDKIAEPFFLEVGAVKDILNLRADRKYLKQKMEFIFKLNPKMTWEVRQKDHTLQVANIVKVSNVSEAAVMMSYYRTISIGAVRRFLLTADNFPEPIAFTATCHDVTEQAKDEFLHTFVFFGVTDAYLKRIRLWMRKTYIDGNQESS